LWNRSGGEGEEEVDEIVLFLSMDRYRQRKPRQQEIKTKIEVEKGEDPNRYLVNTRTQISKRAARKYNFN
jgi:hypothetical protein